jgi:hypothetical protein
MVYILEIDSGAMTYTPRFMNIGSDVKVVRRDSHADTHTAR